MPQTLRSFIYFSFATLANLPGFDAPPNCINVLDFTRTTSNNYVMSFHDSHLFCPVNASQNNVELAKQTHAKPIQIAFEKIGVSIPYHKILSSFDSLQKLGVTNIYLSIKFNSQDYIIRINGKLWPPYERIHETNTLASLKSIGIQTNVLLNDETYQICVKPAENLKLTSILATNGYQNISRALQLLAFEITRYQQLSFHQMVDYPIEKMIKDASMMLRKNFGEQNREYFKNFENICNLILKFIALADTEKVFSHNDLLPSSVFVDLENNKISIVDWEYSAKSYWSNDMSIVSCLLTSEQKLILFEHYQFYQNSIAELKNAILVGNIFLHDFLKLAWKIKPKNLHEYQDEIFSLNKSYLHIIKILQMPINEKNKNMNHVESHLSIMNASFFNSPKIKANGSESILSEPVKGQSKLKIK